MQIGHAETHFQQLDAEPRAAGNSSSIYPGGPPPSYRSSTNADDSATFSSTESSSVDATTYSIKRRNSWTNLIENNENLSKKDLLYCAEPLYTTTAIAATNSANIVMPAYCTWTGNIYENNYQFPEKYNLNGRYAKHFTPFYVLNSSGDPIAVSKLDLTNYGSLCKLNGAEKSSTDFSKRDRMSELKQWFQDPKNKSYTFIALFLIITCCIIAAILLVSKEFTQEARKFSWIPPLIFRNQQGNSTVVGMYQNGHQVRFEILGNLPIKNNYIAIYDFTLRGIAIIDSTLRDNGKNLVCFVMNMNISTMPDQYSLEIAAQNAFKRTEQIHGWEEAWNFLPTSYFGNSSTLFDPSIPECVGARWILLNYTKSDQRGKRCSDCYDFCLPELGIERDYLRAEIFLNIIRRNCFYLFVPEWRSFAAAYNDKRNEYDFQQFYYQDLIHMKSGANNSKSSSGGNNGSGNYGDRLNEIKNVVDGIVQPISDQYRNFESKWISLQGTPRISQTSNIASNAAQSISANSNYQQQQMMENSMSPSIYSNFNLNSNPSSFNNEQMRNVFENGDSDFPSNDRTKPLLPLPPPSYPIQVVQYSPSSLDQENFFTEVLQSYQNFGSGNVHQQNALYGSSNNNVGQLASATKYSGQSNGYNSQLSNSQALNGLSNTVSIDGKNNQPKSIYDQAIVDAEGISKQSSLYTPQPGIDAYVKQAGNTKQNDQANFFLENFIKTFLASLTSSLLSLLDIPVL
uniref:BRICHOS domain-containing protein n=1 Tax=Elaeophora elaphi TaxID=1147741 RepID=A0A158Q8W4_9BILA